MSLWTFLRELLRSHELPVLTEKEAEARLRPDVVGLDVKPIKPKEIGFTRTNRIPDPRAEEHGKTFGF